MGLKQKAKVKLRGGKMKASRRNYLSGHALYYQLGSEIEFYQNVSLNDYTDEELKAELKSINELARAINSLRKLRGANRLIPAEVYTLKKFKQLFKEEEE